MNIVAATANDHVIASLAIQPVGAAGPDEPVVPHRAGDVLDVDQRRTKIVRARHQVDHDALVRFQIGNGVDAGAAVHVVARSRHHQRVAAGTTAQHTLPRAAYQPIAIVRRDQFVDVHQPVEHQRAPEAAHAAGRIVDERHRGHARQIGEQVQLGDVRAHQQHLLATRHQLDAARDPSQEHLIGDAGHLHLVAAGPSGNRAA